LKSRDSTSPTAAISAQGHFFELRSGQIIGLSTQRLRQNYADKDYYGAINDYEGEVLIDGTRRISTPKASSPICGGKPTLPIGCGGGRHPLHGGLL
jgi:hypothetical protein